MSNERCRDVGCGLRSVAHCHGESTPKIIPIAAIYHWLPDGSCKSETLYSETDVAPLREMLLKLEWGDYTDIGELPCCPLCTGVKRYGHTLDCALAALLERIR